MNRFHHLQAWALIFIGAWLMLSPLFVSGYAPGGLAASNSMLIGLISLLLGLAGFVHARHLDQWIDLALGIGPAKAPRRRD